MSNPENEPIGNGTTTLDYLRVRYEWLGVMIDNATAREKELLAEVAVLKGDPEPADAEWAEANGFKWADENGMTRRLSCGLVLVLWGDVADCEKRRGLSLETSSSYVGAGPKNGYKVSNVVSICDDPTRGDVLRLIAALDPK